jgi:RHS repeat-associated protein
MRNNLDLFSINERTSPLVHIIHSYDYNGNHIKRYDPVHAANSELYTYDNLGQIKNLNRGILNNDHSSIPTVNHSESWNFDKTGNWSQYTKNGNTETRTHNAANELQGIATHDANGNMVLMPGLKGKYDAWNRLVEVRDSNDNLIAQYEYNGLNQRIKKTVGTTVTKSFFNENWQEVESVINNQVTSYVWGLRYIDDLVLREKGNERLYSLADPNWNVVAICNNNGVVQEHYTYVAFGKRNVFDASFTAKTGTEFNWNRAFTGQVLDMETELMLYRIRYYHTALGRFINRDPIEYEADDTNLFRYMYNNPLKYQDENGLKQQNTTSIFAPSSDCNINSCIQKCQEETNVFDKKRCTDECFRLDKKFYDWYNKNRDITWTIDLPPCPCNLKNRCVSNDWGEPGPPTGGYHVGATDCMRSNPNKDGHANQCCYDANGKLITSGSGQGSSDWGIGGISLGFFTHLTEDMNPANWATFLDGKKWGCYSEAYLNVRPQVKFPDCPGVPTPVK